MRQLITILLGLFSLTLSAKGYEIKVEIKGARDSTLYMAIHFGNNKYARDTAVLDKNGKASFKKDKPLPGGMYLIALGGTHILDFLISDSINQTFTIITTQHKYTESLHFKNSQENEAFADFTRFMLTTQIKDQELATQQKNAVGDSATIAKINQVRIDNQEALQNNISQIQQQFPNSLLANIAQSMNAPVVPDLHLTPETPGRDSILYWHYYEFEKNHFWDNFNLSDVRMLNTPILIPAIDRYFQQVLIKRADSIIPPLDRFIAKGSSSPDMTKFFVGHLFNLFMQSDIMGMETVTIHLIDNYYLKGKIKDIDPKFMTDIKDYAEKQRPTLIGKKASNLKMQTINGTYESLYDIDSPYTLVYFFEPSCGHCKQETPKVYKIYQKYKDKGLTGFCVYAQAKKEEWVEYVAQNNLQWTNVWDPENRNDFRRQYSVYSVPQVYLLDKNKMFIGRRLNAETLDKLLDNLLNKK